VLGTSTVRKSVGDFERFDHINFSRRGQHAPRGRDEEVS